jgi:hypothetical protein
MNCLSDTSWQSREGWETTLTLFKRRATIAYNGLNGTILSHKFSKTPRTAVDIGAPELLQVFDTLLGPVNRTSTYGRALTVIGLDSNKPVLPLTVWQYFLGVLELSKNDCRANRRAITGLQSLLVIPIYHCQAKDFAELRRLLLGLGTDNDSTVGQVILSLFPVVSPDTDIYPAVLRNTLQVGRRSLIAYVVLAGFTLTLCLVALVIGNRTLAGRGVRHMSPFQSLNVLTACEIQDENRDSIPQKDFLPLGRRTNRDKILETAKMRVVLAATTPLESLETTTTPLEPTETTTSPSSELRSLNNKDPSFNYEIPPPTNNFSSIPTDPAPSLLKSHYF